MAHACIWGGHGQYPEWRTTTTGKAKLASLGAEAAHRSHGHDVEFVFNSTNRVLATENAVIPYAVGVDIACSRGTRPTAF